MKKLFLILLFPLLLQCGSKEITLPYLKVSENRRYLMDENGKPFFWLGDTGWLLFNKLNREETERYLEDRKQKSFNVIQVMLIHDLRNTVNAYGDSALINNNLAALNTTEGSDPLDYQQYDFWDHVDFTIKLAEKKGIYMALVPIWGFNVRGGNVTVDEAAFYASFLATRYKDQSNIIWLNGGDILGSDSLNIWQTIGNTLNQIDTNHLITFHPFGRTMSSDWFHNETWLDFNMFQSGHRSYDQDDTERCFGEDNWKYVEIEYNLKPVKPTIDGEPSYEYAPHGLHDTLQPRWTGDDARRYAYWSVFAGAFGHTYGHSSIMQFYRSEDTKSSYGANIYWEPAMDALGAMYMKYLKQLILSQSYFTRVPDQSLIVDEHGEKYGYLIATRGEHFAMVYTYNGKSFSIDGKKLDSDYIEASWFNPRNGETTLIDTFKNEGPIAFDPLGEMQNGNDWVLVLKSVK
jgi:hypothetical protein